MRNDENYADSPRSEEERAKVDPKGEANQVKSWVFESKTNMTVYQQRWAANLRMMKGIWDVDEKTRSEVRGRSKIYFRKVWSTVWRLMASLYRTFMKDSEQVKISGRMGNDEDVPKAGILQVMVEYHRDRMYRKQNLFLQFLWGFHDILTNGVSVGLFSWEYDAKKKIDGPKFRIYPMECVFPDMDAALETEMRYIVFESFHTMDELKAMKFKNLDKIKPSSPENSSLRNARNKNTGDPAQNPSPNEYPSPGRYTQGKDEKKAQGKFKVHQAFYKKEGTIYKCVTDGGDVVLEEGAPSKYGDEYPCVMGVCLTEPHKLFGEGWPEPLEAPQISLNDIINRRKDNISLVMNRHKYVNRFANVDLSSLMNSRAGGATLMDDVNAVKEADAVDVTQSAYVEAAADEGMMQEMSGVTPAKQGMEKSSKATIGQINLTESNEKIDLYLAIVGETFVRNFFQKLTYLIQRFDTNEDLLRVANRTYWKKETMKNPGAIPYEVYDVDDMDADVIVEVGVGQVSRDLSIREMMLAIEKAVQANQSTIALLSTGALPKEEVKFFDVVKFTENLLPKIGVKNFQDYQIGITPPPPEMPGGPGAQGLQGLRGLMAPQTAGPGIPDGGGGV